MSSRRMAKALIVVGVALVGFYWYPREWAASGFVKDFYANAATSILCISLAVLLIDRLNERRDALQDKQRLIREMGSGDLATAGRATKEVGAKGWLSDGSLIAADLSGANLKAVRLSHSQLSRADLSRSVLQDAELQYTDLSGVHLRSARAEGCNLKGAVLIGANLRSAGLSGSTLDEVDLSGGGEFLKAEFANASIRNANLTGASLESCDLRNCDFTGANLENAKFAEATIDGAIFDGANLERADFSDVKGWRLIRSMNKAQLAGVKASDEFKTFALTLGAEL
jgi:uncharacterized protein YjbI with pentapeptide repeats